MRGTVNLIPRRGYQVIMCNFKPPSVHILLMVQLFNYKSINLERTGVLVEPNHQRFWNIMVSPEPTIQ